MVAPALLLVLGLLGAPERAAAGVGVAGVVRGSASLLGQSGAIPLSTAAVLPDGATVELGADGWAELYLVGGLRLRLSAGTRLTASATTAGTLLELSVGRVAVTSRAGSAPVQLRVGRYRAVLAPGSSVLTDASLGRTLLVEARVGQVSVEDDAGAIVSIVPGQVALAGEAGRLLVRRGSGALANLSASEARTALRDPAGLRAFLVERARTANIGGLDVRPVDRLVRVGPEILGTETGPTGASAEEALRPPAFYDEEVPSKGPNVQVEVEFARD